VLGTVKVESPSRAFGQPVPLTPQDILFGRAIAVIGTSIEPTGLKPGDVLKVSVGWRAANRPSADYTAFVHVLDRAGKLVAQHDGPPLQGAFPTTAWDPGDTIDDTVDVPLPSTLPPDRYAVTLGLYRPQDGIRLADASGQTEVVVGSFDLH
jgi:hypothetical protein